MHFTFITLFPELFTPVLTSSILGRSLKKDVFSYSCINIRDFAIDEYGHVDDKPYGGGPGMVLRADVVEKALVAGFEKRGLSITSYNRSEVLILVTAAGGEKYTQERVQSFALYKEIFIICGHYEGIDQRFVDQYANFEISIGQYVLTGGELAAMVITDSIIRLLPGALGALESISEESYSFGDSEGLLPEYPHYTRPEVFNGSKVPEVLVSGNHQKIKDWRLDQARSKRLKIKS